MIKRSFYYAKTLFSSSSRYFQFLLAEQNNLAEITCPKMESVKFFRTVKICFYQGHFSIVCPTKRW